MRSGPGGSAVPLSDEDVSTIALSLQLKAELVTDDFALSNVAKNLNIKVLSEDDWNKIVN